MAHFFAIWVIENRFDVGIKLIVFLVALEFEIFSVFNIVVLPNVRIYHIDKHLVELRSLFKRRHLSFVGVFPLFNKLDQNSYARSMALFRNLLVDICFVKVELLRKSYELRPS